MEIIVQSTLPVVASRLSRLYARFNGDLTPLMEKVGAIIENDTAERLKDTKTDPDGKKWADLAPATIAAKKRRKTDKGGVLIDSRRMVDSLTHESGRDYAIIGVNAASDDEEDPKQYAVYHQTGTKNMPAHPIFGLSNKDKEDIQDWVASTLKGWWYGR